MKYKSHNWAIIFHLKTTSTNIANCAHHLQTTICHWRREDERLMGIPSGGSSGQFDYLQRFSLTLTQNFFHKNKLIKKKWVTLFQIPMRFEKAFVRWIHHYREPRLFNTFKDKPTNWLEKLNTFKTWFRNFQPSLPYALAISTFIIMLPPAYFLLSMYAIFCARVTF